MTDQEKIMLIIGHLNTLSEEDATAASELMEACDAGALTSAQRTEFERIYDICKAQDDAVLAAKESP